ERQPVCGPCSISSRDCVFPDIGSRHNGEPPSEITEISTAQTTTDLASLRALVAEESSSPSHVVPQVVAEAATTPLQQSQVSSLPAAYGYTYSPDTVASELLTADLASTRWLGLLAHDAAQADKGFSLTSTLNVPSRVSEHEDPEVTSEHYAWQLNHDIPLQSHEAYLFRTFVEHAASWLDLCDPRKHFSTHATRLALRNLGLMKAILALASRHAIARTQTPETDVNVPIQYYYETLHYVQESLQYTTYTRSEELLATVIIISTYEMLDDANSNWKRHLKGVFWIQRSQEVHGASGGLRQAVWWAWLRQDLWAAFREKRACFSFWRPIKVVSELSQDELANRAIYLLSQAVNYCAESASTSMAMSEKVQASETLLAALEQWRASLGPAYRPLPTPHLANSAFRPLWIHPPQYGVAIQAYHFAKILITLHRPAEGGFHTYLQTQRVLSDAVDAICGIAMELKDEGCQILSAQCLFGAGLCTQDMKNRDIIIALIRSCEARTGWPMSNLIDDLRAEWASFS
ncbi:hypothetical protein M406DRAFT_245423, partial [Cryphonectria parasitica EP155]